MKKKWTAKKIPKIFLPYVRGRDHALAEHPYVGLDFVAQGYLVLLEYGNTGWRLERMGADDQWERHLGTPTELKALLVAWLLAGEAAPLGR